MKNLFIAFIFGIILSGCDTSVEANFIRYSKVCIDDIIYIQFPSGAATVQVDQHGKPVSCDE
jgi:hypothetical protein